MYLLIDDHAKRRIFLRHIYEGGKNVAIKN
jgi:hypothetical protein